MSGRRFRFSGRTALVRALGFGLLWWVLVEGDLREWPLALLVIAAATICSVLLLPGAGLRWRLTGALRFVPYFFKESLLGGTDVARRALTPRLPLSPGFIEYPLRLETEAARVLFVWVVSLLPGTASAQLGQDTLKVHVLDTSLPLREKLAELEEHLARLFHEAP